MKKNITFKIVLINLLSVFVCRAMAQDPITEGGSVSRFLRPADSLNKKRLYGLLASGTTFYTAAVIQLNNVWYAQYPKSKLHTFDDSHEWRGVDKAGHVLTAYSQSRLTFDAFRWAGVKERPALWIGVASGTVFQTTLELLDGRSAHWGFSWADMGANTAGCILFGLQQAFWHEQRITLKISNTPRSYPATEIRSVDGTATTTIRDRAHALFGKSYTQTFIKDYNGFTTWASVNVAAFLPKNSRFPSWLNVAFGYGADNIYGGFDNIWTLEKGGNGALFSLNTTEYPRYSQFYLSLDVDLTRIKTKNRIIKTLAKTFHYIKIPSPTLEYNTLGKWRFMPLMW